LGEAHHTLGRFRDKVLVQWQLLMMRERILTAKIAKKGRKGERSPLRALRKVLRTLRFEAFAEKP
jgi:hypothetical protein